VAATVAREKPVLHFFGIAHAVDGLWDRWDLLVSSDQLEPWRMASLTYIANHLRNTLQSDDLVRIAHIVALPADNKIIQSLIQDDQITRGKLVSLSHDANFDQVFVMWPKKQSNQPTAV
jgi:hypothetical protein